MNVKRIFATFLALVLVLTMTTGAFAAETGTNGSAALCLDVLPGASESVVTVSLTGCDGVTNGRFTVSYDAAASALLRVETTGAYAVSSVNDRTAGVVSLAWVGSDLTADKTAMLKLYFRKKDNADATYTAQSKGIYAGKEAVEVAAASASESDVPFKDIDGHWAEDDIIRAYHAGLVKGIEADQFGPEVSLTRAMFVTMLYRMAGEPEVRSTKTCFTDVPANKYYAEAVAWAVDAGVTYGMTETTFGPNLKITREQMMTMLYRYAETVEGRDVSARADLSVFSDSASVSGWAKDAVAWAVAEEIIFGYTGGTLQPKVNATRAQTAAILCRYLGI